MVKVSGYFRREGGLVFAVSSDDRFVTHGGDEEEALRYMRDKLRLHAEISREISLEGSGDDSTPVEGKAWLLVV